LDLPTSVSWKFNSKILDAGLWILDGIRNVFSSSIEYPATRISALKQLI